MKVDEQGGLHEGENPIDDAIARKMVQLQLIHSRFCVATAAVRNLEAQLAATAQERADGDDPLAGRLDALRLLETAKRVSAAHTVLMDEAVIWLREEQQ